MQTLTIGFGNPHKNDSVVRSHNIGDCFFFTSQDQADLVARLNTAQLEYEVDTGDNSPYYDMGEEAD